MLSCQSDFACLQQQNTTTEPHDGGHEDVGDDNETTQIEYWSSGDDHCPILNRKQCPPFPFGVHALETVYRKQ